MKRSSQAFLFVILLLSVFAGACSLSISEFEPPFNLEQMFLDVFHPQAGETVLVMIDEPHAGISDNAGWKSRREMARDWHNVLMRVGDEHGFTVQPMLTYPATGQHNGPLPEIGKIGSEEVRLDQAFADVNIILALTQFSATAPIVEFTHKNPNLRAASMPMISQSMEQTALAANYAELASRCSLLASKLDRAIGAEVLFSTGHQMYFDLRYRTAEVDDGQLPPDKGAMRVINLPSGEAFIAPYEGEIENEPSKTEGMLPVLENNDELVVGKVVQNRIVEVIGDGPGAQAARETLAMDEALRNVAELGLGCNDKAVVTGNVLEDEKVLGVHWALGRSDHLGGVVGPEDFQDPAYVTHLDFVYPSGGDLAVTRLALELEDGTREEIIRDGEYTPFPRRFTLSLDHLLLVWLLVSAASFSLIAVDLEQVPTASWDIKLAWVWITAITGLFGLLIYVASFRTTRSISTPQRMVPTWKLALGDAAFSVAGVVTSMIVFLIFLKVFPALNNTPFSLAILYCLILLITLVGFRAAAVSKGMGLRFLVAVRRSWLAEIVAVHLILTVILPVMLVPLNSYPHVFDTVPSRMWLILSLAAILALVIVFPYKLWLTHRGFTVWPVISKEQRHAALMGHRAEDRLRRMLWLMLPISIVMLVLTIIGIFLWIG